MSIDYFLNVMQIFWGGLLTILLLISAFTDLCQRRILNLVTLPTICIAILVHSLLGGWLGFLFSVQGLGLGFICFLLPYCMGGMGAGDVKLMSAVGAILGFRHMTVVLLFVAVTGGLLSLGLMLYRRTLKISLYRIWLSMFYLGAHSDGSLLKFDKNELHQNGMPFAVAIAGGVFLYMIYLWGTTGMLPLQTVNG